MSATSARIDVSIVPIQTPEQIHACFEAMQLLRPDYQTPEAFVEHVLRLQRRESYRLLGAQMRNGAIGGVVGFRFAENLMHGRHVYVDDLVTLRELRCQGFGAALMKAVVTQARDSRCRKVLLDTSAENEAGKRFYLSFGFAITANRFTMVLA